MNVTVGNLKSKYSLWLRQLENNAPLVNFRIAFAGVWLAYDVLDLYFGGTRASFWGAIDSSIHFQIRASQVALIVIQLGLVFGFRPNLLFLLAALVRGYEAWFFPVNDFLYYLTIAFIMSLADSSSPKKPAPTWVRDVLVLQTAWIYFATALLKLNPSFLSGGDFYVRQNYLLAARNWWYPAFYREWISTATVNSYLAWLGVISEFAMAFFLVGWFLRPDKRNFIRPLLVVAVLGIHTFGAFSLNVFFFSASMIVQVLCLTTSPKSQRGGAF